jgi:hypothetical protein
MKRVAMSRTSRPGPATFGSILLARIGWQTSAAFEPTEARSSASIVQRARTEADLHWVLYVGLGDQFDDDRRLIRAADPVAAA